MSITDTLINKDFLIRTRPDGEVKWTLHSARKFRNFVGDQVALNFFQRAMNSTEQKIQMRLRRGYDVVFVCR